MIKVNEDYSGYSAVYTYARKLKIKDDELVFDLEDIYEDIDGGDDESSYKYYEGQTISDILDNCPEEMVISCLKSILNCAFDSDVIGLNRLQKPSLGAIFIQSRSFFLAFLKNNYFCKS